MSRTALVSIGVAFLAIVIFTHVAEHWRIFPAMGWGLPNSPGHYLDLSSAVLAVTFLLAAALRNLKL